MRSSAEGVLLANTGAKAEQCEGKNRQEKMPPHRDQQDQDHRQMRIQK